MFLAGALAFQVTAKPKARHIVYIGLDGWGAYSVPKADMPNVRTLMSQGCYTLHKRTVNPSSSAPNWASMFMGVYACGCMTLGLFLILSW